MNTLHTAVLGLGRIGWQFHIPSILQHPGFTLAAVVDPVAERREEAAREFGGVRGYDDYRTLLANEALDLVVVASPTHLHAEHAIAAMERGIDVFCDKPMAPSLEDADRMIAAMERTGRKLMVYQPHRATAEVAALRAILESGLLGRLYMIKHTVSNFTQRADWQALKQYGGGMLNNYGAHYIDQVLYLTGARAERITCAMRRMTSLGDADDVVKGLIELDNGVIIDMEINMAAAQNSPPWFLLGDRGAATLADDRSAFVVQYCRDEELAPISLSTGLAAAERRYGNAEPIPWHTTRFPLADYAALDYYQFCYEYYALNGKPFVPVAQTREVMRILDVCRQSAGWA